MSKGYFVLPDWGLFCPELFGPGYFVRSYFVRGYFVLEPEGELWWVNFFFQNKSKLIKQEEEVLNENIQSPISYTAQSLTKTMNRPFNAI